MSKSEPHQVDIAVGANIRARRKQMNMSQEGLAEAIGLTFQQVQKYERGMNRVSCSKLVEIAQALDCHPAALLPKQDWLDDAEGESWADAAREVFFDDNDLLAELRHLTPLQLKSLRVFLQTLRCQPGEVIALTRAA